MSIQTEKRTIQKMIRLFCHKKHGTKEALCEECSELLDDALTRLDKCPHGDNKPICRNCTAYCYPPEMKKRISDVMRFSGPRMLWKYPGSAIRHLTQSIRKKPR